MWETSQLVGEMCLKGGVKIEERKTRDRKWSQEDIQ